MKTKRATIDTIDTIDFIEEQRKYILRNKPADESGICSRRGTAASGILGRSKFELSNRMKILLSVPSLTYLSTLNRG